jgi:hypothetical protein
MSLRLLILFSIMIEVVLTSKAHGLTRIEIASDGILRLQEPIKAISKVVGNWRFSNLHIQDINTDSYNSLVEKPAMSGSLYYSNFQQLPEIGSYVLAIDSDVDQYPYASFGGLMSQAQILLINKHGRSVLYEDSDFSQGNFAYSRKQIPDFVFGFPLASGRNFLVYNYRQKGIFKKDTVFTNAALSSPFLLGPKRLIEKRVATERISLQIPLGIFICLSIYSLLIYVSRRGEDRESLLLFLISGSYSLKELSSQAVFSAFSSHDTTFVDLNSFVFVGPLFTTAIFVYTLHDQYEIRALRPLFWLALTNAGLCLLAAICNNHLSFIPMLQGFFQIGMIINAIVFFFFFLPSTLVAAIKSKRLHLALFAAGSFLIGAGTLSDGLKSLTDSDRPWLSMWGGLCFALVLAKNNSRKFAEAFTSTKELNTKLITINRSMEDLNATLEQKVVARTAEIDSLLQHIPQGVLSVVEDGQIDRLYSSQLVKILGHSKIASSSFYESFLQYTNLNDDVKDQIWQSLLASVKSPEFSFQMNSHIFPQEITYTFQDTKKHLEMTWNSESNVHEIVDRILITIRDITSEVANREELANRKAEYTIIVQLIELGTEKSIQFFGSCNMLLEESQRLIRLRVLDNSSLKILFVNMHTMKGAARTLGLKDIASVFHEVESYYSILLKSGQNPDFQRLQADIDRAKEVYARYQRINSAVLGRERDLQKITIDRKFLEENYSILTRIELDNSLAPDLKQIIKENCVRLTTMIFMTVEKLLDDVLLQAKKIAEDLHKKPPLIEKNVGFCLVTKQQETALRNSFIHLLRNSIDHGIESAEERKAAGKSEVGTLHIDAFETESQIQIEMSDDGRGFAVSKMRDKGLALGIIKADASLEEIFECAFQQGISTSTSLTEISGRGVGMDAVRRFLTNEGGFVKFAIIGPVPGNPDYYHFKIVITLPNRSSKYPAILEGSNSQEN